MTDIGRFHLGGVLDPSSGERTGDPLTVASHDLTTHGVIVGMTGSGKTGLGVVLLEEALLSGIPALVIDPKGDMGNLFLNFPSLEPGAFEPWVDPAEAKRDGITVPELAARTASRWREGLAGWGLGHERMTELGNSALEIYTPGSSAGAPLNLLGSLRSPDLSWDVHAEMIQDEIEGLVTSLLTVAGLSADPISDPEHILLANVIEHEWRAGRDLDLPRLVGLARSPPFRKLGVFALDDFFPEKKRTDLAMRLNGLLASSSFSGWTRGEPLDVRTLLEPRNGRPACSIVYLAHLSDAERQFVVTLLLTKLITWMRQQPGTSDLRALVYMDEMFGFAPPTAMPPSKKPLLTLFKQARAHGVGLVVATQNPVDIDYKMMSNAGTWMVGRLQTERDKLRVLEGLRSASGVADIDALDRAIGGLGKRQFLFTSTRGGGPTLFTTRWAMSFLRGTITLPEIARLRGGPPAAHTSLEQADGEHAPAAAAMPAPPPPTSGETSVPPAVPDSTPVYFLDPGATWASEVGCSAGSPRLEAALVARVESRFDERVADVDHVETWEAVFFPLGERFDPSEAIAVDYDERDLRSTAPPDARYFLPAAPITRADYFRSVASELREHLYRSAELRIFRNAELELYSRPGESEESFRERCVRVADERADEEATELRDRYETRIDRAREAIDTAERRVEELEVDVGQRRQQELFSGAGKLITMFLGGKGSARSLSGFASRRSMTVRTKERLRTAEDRVEDREAEIEKLEDELADELARMVEQADEVAAEVEPLDIRLEKDDIAVTEVALTWIPRDAAR